MTAEHPPHPHQPGHPESAEAKRERLHREANLIAQGRAEIAAGHGIALADLESWMNKLESASASALRSGMLLQQPNDLPVAVSDVNEKRQNAADQHRGNDRTCN